MAGGEAEACGLCSEPRARYTCPRCNVRYCSLPCYRGAPHRACAELFYRAAVLGELRARAGGAERRPEIHDSLRRLREAEAQGPELGLDPRRASASRLWAALSPRQRADFQRRVAGGEAEAWLREWRPWWEGRGLVVEGGEWSKEGQEDQRADTEDAGGAGGGTEPIPDPVWETVDSVPPVCSNIARLQSLTTKPSPLIPYSVVNVLYAYAFAMRLVNGDVSGAMREEFVGIVMAISQTLKGDSVYASTGEALQAGAAAAPSTSSNPFLAVRTMQDTSILLAGDGRAPSGHYTLAAISHLSRILRRAKERGQGGAGTAECYRARKKCAFLLSWAREQQERVLAILSLEAQQEFTTSLHHLVQVEQDKSSLEAAWGDKRPPARKVLIEELNS